MENQNLEVALSSSTLQGPDLKKPKTCATSSDDDNSSTAIKVETGSLRRKRYKRRKIAVFVAYCGVGYQGMQKNPGARTIEGDLEEAFFHSGAVLEQDRGNPRRCDWARSARTDKGVSAVGQVVSGRFYVDPPGFVERLNANLPSQIRVFGYKRATASFNAKKFCDRRRYVYLLPVFALDPRSHRDRDSVMASMGSDNELIKCVECSERGRKAVGASANNDTDEDASVCNQISVTNEANLVSINGDGKNKSSISDDEMISGVEEQRISEGEEGREATGFFHYGEKEKERFNRILNCYVGSHNFHNFTTRIKPEDPSARRHIVRFDANTTVCVDGIQFVKCEVVGQSFMLHQIRKMVGLAVSIMRDYASSPLLRTALQEDVKVNVPTAPEVGLYLDECFFTSYNQKWKDSHEELSMEAYEREAEDFKMKQVYPHIASAEHGEGAVALWLHSLNHRNYPHLLAHRHGNSNGDDITENGSVCMDEQLD